MNLRPFSVGPAAQERLSSEIIDAIRPSLEAMDGLFRQSLKDRIDLFKELTAAVKTEPYDKAAVEALLTLLVDSRSQSELQQWRLVSDTLASLNADQRAVFAEIVFPRPGPQEAWLPGPGGPPPMQLFPPRPPE